MNKYSKIKTGKNKSTPAHRLVVEYYLGRKLKPEEVVHHINEIKSDNRIENLVVFEDNASHIAFHKLKNVSTFKACWKDNTRKNIERTLNSMYGIVLYGPYYKKEKEDKLNKLKEMTKKALAENAGASFIDEQAEMGSL